MARQPRDTATLQHKKDQFFDPKTLEPYSGRVFARVQGHKNIIVKGLLLGGREYGISTASYAGTKAWETNWKEGKKHGLETHFYSDGTKELETSYKDGKEHGLETAYYKNGERMYELTYENGTMHGHHRAWAGDGRLIHQENFLNGTGELVLDIDVHGWTKIQYRKGKPHGLKISYNKDGVKWRTVSLRNGVLDGPDLQYEVETGRIISETNYKDGKKHGFEIDLDVADSRNWKEGKKHGIETLHWENGTKRSETNWKLGKKHGLETLYWETLIGENGTKSSETNWKLGKKHGLETLYWEDGTKQEECQYTNGIKGECKTF